MTKFEARAILMAQKRILEALDVCRRRLGTSDEWVYFDNYWGRSIESIMTGQGYGSAPTARAQAIMEGDDE
jgi:hypothetical protein